MQNIISQKFTYGNNNVIIETGRIARQATSSVIVNIDDTIVLATMVYIKQTEINSTFLPLVVNYQERTYAAGRFPGGFFRREGRPTENEILTSRLIDRAIRPLFPDDFYYSIQITVTVMSVNPQVYPDIAAIIGVSAVISISDIPFLGPIGVARIGYINKNYCLNPTNFDTNNNNDLDLIVISTSQAIVMIEGAAKLIDEYQMLSAIKFGYEQQQIVIDNINLLADKVNVNKSIIPIIDTANLISYICTLLKNNLCNIYPLTNNKVERINIINNIKSNIMQSLILQYSDIGQNELSILISRAEKIVMRDLIISNNIRVDGRKFNDIRNINIALGILPRTHGSALFSRGETQTLVSTTLGTERNAQNVDELLGERIDKFLLHYNFLPYCVGEIGLISSPKRREIGHGHLAKRAIIPVLPYSNNFSYTIRLVSEVTESDGSSSMASVCGASLSLMDAGVPIKTSVAGVAMGLIKNNNKFIILSDIISNEDYFGDMDCKIAGSYQGITAIQMDIKTNGITFDMIKETLLLSKEARIYVLDIMSRSINKPRSDISKFAPRIYTIKINPNKIKNIIGKGGSVIKSLTEETNTSIDVHNDGTIKIAAYNYNQANVAIKRIYDLIKDIEVGQTYIGIVIRIVNFGIFFNIKGKEGLVHISQITNKYKNINDTVRIGQKIPVKVLEIERSGRIRLSMKGIVS
ncbi:MAG: polyribonucleotide nucleotidyltransferase [Candidatus Lightella neohaematopini]|nr:polyribonucleotide nucleotidyltransferase [Candidatus Lightella neohaematopini]MCV2528966.1 polyribonucleotide nucleotidyltransferase [Candidatus Lightella neohaematopini]